MTAQELANQASQLLQQLGKVQIRGQGWSSNPSHGHAFNPPPCEEAAAEGSGGIPIPPPPTPTGACCNDGDCSIDTETHCESGGGTYQGDDTTCVEVDCGEATSGACCVGGDCSVETPSGCDALGGTYQGDNTTCDPSPCPLPTCCEGAYSHDGRFWMTATLHSHGQQLQIPCSLDFTCIAGEGECYDAVFTCGDPTPENVPNGIMWETNNEKNTPYGEGDPCDTGSGCSAGEFSNCQFDAEFVYSNECMMP